MMAQGCRLWLCLALASSLQLALVESECQAAGDTMPYLPGVDIEKCARNINMTVPQFASGMAALSKVGDVNGDGKDDFAYAEVSSATVFVFFGQPGTATPPAFDGSDGYILEGEGNEDFGASLSGGFDLNSDGFDDFVVGSPKFNDGAGRAFIVFGSSVSVGRFNTTDMQRWSGVVEIENPVQDIKPACSPSLISEGTCPDAKTIEFGLVSAGIGDINDDGADDSTFPPEFCVGRVSDLCSCLRAVTSDGVRSCNRLKGRGPRPAARLRTPVRGVMGSQNHNLGRSVRRSKVRTRQHAHSDPRTGVCRRCAE